MRNRAATYNEPCSQTHLGLNYGIVKKTFVVLTFECNVILFAMLQMLRCDRRGFLWKKYSARLLDFGCVGQLPLDGNPFFASDC
jgi:hypothetical protein